MPAAQIELDDRDESLSWIVNLWHGHHQLWMGHEAALCVSFALAGRNPSLRTHFVMRSNIDRGSRMKVGRVIRLRSAPGRSCDMM